MNLSHSNSSLALKLGFAFTAFASIYLLYATFKRPSFSFVNMSSQPQGAIVHIVMFQYKPTLSATLKNDVSSAFIAMKDGCRLPDGSPYVVSIDGGMNNSPEGMTKGMEHTFVVTFRNAAERDYYLDTDPVHQAFKASIADKVVDATVFDFESGDFARQAATRKRRPSDETHVRTV